MPWNRHARTLVALVAVGLAAAACGGSTKNNAGGSSSSSDSPSASPSAAATFSPPASAVSLTETGSTLLFPLFEAWQVAYHTQVSTVTITSQGTGSGTGIADAAAGTVDIGASDAYLPPAQVAAHPALENIPLAISAQQIDYNLPTLKGVHLKLDGTTLAKIYLGKITTWNDPAIAAANPGVNLPSMKIVPVHRSDGSGDTFLFTQYLDKQDPADWGKIGFGTTVAFPAVPGALGEHGNGGMVSGCGATPGCIAYIGISYLGKATKAGLSYAELKNGNGQYELPTPATIAAEAAGFTSQTPANETISLINGNVSGGYPIVNYEYAIVSKTLSGTTAQAVKAFLAWAIDPNNGNSSTYLDPVNFQPLPAQVAQLSLTQIAAIGS